MSRIVIDLSDPQLLEAFSDCEVGDIKDLTGLTFSVTAKGDTLEGSITRLAYDGYEYDLDEETPEDAGSEAEDLEDAETAAPVPAASLPKPKPALAAKPSK